MLKRIKALLKKGFLLDPIHDALIERERIERTNAARNPLCSHGMKAFSQADEDGITLEIACRLGIVRGTYCEFGVGDGLECNSLILASLGWRGFWISGRDIAFSTANIDPDFFTFDKRWVGHDNVVDLYQAHCQRLGIADVDVLSFDLDSNDLFYVQELLEAGTRPELFIVEYNAKFPPPVRWSTKKESKQIWQQTDYFGASLQSFADLFAEHGYRLICCNAATGANAFFVKNQAVGFEDVPNDIDDIYMPPDYRLLVNYGHPKDTRTVERLFEIGGRIASGSENPEFD